MRASSILAVLLPSAVLAQGATTIQVTSTRTSTIVNVLTATMTQGYDTTSSYAAVPYAAVTTPSTTSSAVKVTTTSLSGPVQVTQNAAPRGAVDAMLAGLAGAAVFMAL